MSDTILKGAKNTGFYYKDGVFFARKSNGDVTIRQYSSSKPDGKLLTRITIDKDSWVSIIASVAKDPETTTTINMLTDLHAGNVTIEKEKEEI